MESVAEVKKILSKILKKKKELSDNDTKVLSRSSRGEVLSLMTFSVLNVKGKTTEGWLYVCDSSRS